MARAQAEAIAAAIRNGQGDLATRADLRTEISGLEVRMYRAMLLQAVAVAGIVIAALKLS